MRFVGRLIPIWVILFATIALAADSTPTDIAKRLDDSIVVGAARERARHHDAQLRPDGIGDDHLGDRRHGIQRGPVAETESGTRRA
jgi:hypothetical protein